MPEGPKINDLNERVRSLPSGIQNIQDPGGFLRIGDQLPVRAAAVYNNIPLLILSNSGLGIVMDLGFLNGQSWDESTREGVLGELEQILRLNSDKPIVDFSYSFQAIRRPLTEGELSALAGKKNYPITKIRVDGIKKLASELQVQRSDLYLTITAHPSSFLLKQQIGFIDRVKSIWDKRIKYRAESLLLEDVITQFSDRIRQIVGGLSAAGISCQLPRDENELLMTARKAWRPHYSQPGANGYFSDLVLKSLNDKHFKTPSDFLTKDLQVDQFKKHWIADGCLNMLFSMESAPDPHLDFSALESARFLKIGTKEGVRNLPYFGTFTVAWSSMTKEQGDLLFRLRNAIAMGMTSDRKGLFEDKMAAKEARDINRMHEEFIEGGSDMVRASVMFQLSIPLHYLDRYFDTKLADPELIISIAREVSSDLDAIGRAKWKVEDRTHYSAWINSIPGSIKTSGETHSLPMLYLSLSGAMHLVPLFSTISPDQSAYSGGNYFITEDSQMFVFDHFSKNNGAAANFSICGATGSGKSVLAQTLIMMLEPKEPNIMIMDFGGGNVGSWTKLCSIMGGVELKFGSARPPRINPFQLNQSDSFPNRSKKKSLAIELGLDPNSEDDMVSIDNLYLYLRSEDSPFLPVSIKLRSMIERCPIIEDYVLGLNENDSYKKIVNVLDLKPTDVRPGDKAVAAIRLVLNILLAQDVGADGPKDSPWSHFLLDDINDAIMYLYENFKKMPHKPGDWPTLSDFCQALTEVHEARRGDLESGVSDGVVNYALLMRRLSQYCRGGLDPFLDGQTNVNINRRVIEHGVEVERPAKFVLADMANIADPRKIALYTVVVNEFMSRVLYNARESRGVIIRDEAWLFMRSKIAAPYLEADYRLARKYGFSVVTIAQQYTDFSSSVLQNNTQNWVVCSLGSSDEIGHAHERFRFTEEERSLFSSGRMGTQIKKDAFSGRIVDAFSRTMIANKSGKFFIKNKISLPERWITTTDDDETFIFNYYKDTKFHGRPVIELVEWLCTGEYIKDEGLRRAAEKSGRVIRLIS